MYACIYIYLRIYVFMYVCMHACMCIHACMHACMHVCMYVCMSTYSYACIRVCVCVCLSTRAYSYYFIVCTTIYIYIHTFTHTQNIHKHLHASKHLGTSLLSRTQYLSNKLSPSYSSRSVVQRSVCDLGTLENKPLSLGSSRGSPLLASDTFWDAFIKMSLRRFLARINSLSSSMMGCHAKL
jgi:hypothetical protein